MKHPEKSHPGISGRKPTIKNPIAVNVYISREARDILIALGNGDLSLGVRLAADLVAKYRLKNK